MPVASEGRVVDSRVIVLSLVRYGASKAAMNGVMSS